ncbi:hypothetical protein BJY04DRAFT_54235 [Aspergillus karnatakaensis]|uniref:uncharacterized protein n=1 Tax=Aspergillus karnatakaensis TaxID=1810916 RepID=UPI003CCD19CE
MASSFPAETRRCSRKPLRRSRYGCRNCKLRKLKCDEKRPECKRCTSYGVQCNYISDIPDLQPLAGQHGRILRVPGKHNSQPSRALTNAVWTSDASTSYRYDLNTRCQDFITRYLGRSLMTPHDPNMVHVNRQLLELAFTRPYLMHASLAVSLTYDRHLNTGSTRRTTEECYHWSQATTLFNKCLKSSIKPEDRDPIWGTAAALVILTFSSPEASKPGQLWPLTSTSNAPNPSISSTFSDSEALEFEHELDWLRMNEGKLSLWHAVNPIRPESIFSGMAASFAQMFAPLPLSGIEGIPSPLVTACSLEHSSTPSTNPYFHAAHAVARISQVPDREISTGDALPFMRSIVGDFKQLFLRRDPVALLLLLLWLSKAGRGIWWIELRARVQCPAICAYLKLYHPENAAVLALLPGGALANGWLDHS